jgi:predicted flap endonuclease-1-like 5' DNA nuclease
MSILIERASFEDRAKFFHKNRFTITQLLDDLAEPAKKPKRKKKSETKAKAKAKPKAKAKAKAKTKAKPKSKAKEKAKEKAKPKAKLKETPKVEEKKPNIEEPVTDNIIEVAVPEVIVPEVVEQEAPVMDTPAPTDTPDDLTRINGLGAKMVGSLNVAGITQFEQLANLTKKEIAKLGKSIRGFASSYERKDFKKQAQEFSK